MIVVFAFTILGVDEPLEALLGVFARDGVLARGAVPLGAVPLEPIPLGGKGGRADKLREDISI